MSASKNKCFNKTIILSNIQALIIRDVYISVNNSKEGYKTTTTTTTTKQTLWIYS